MLLQFDSDEARFAPVRLFYSYSRKDRALRDSLDEHLVVLKRQGFLETWYDRQISPGEGWKNAIDNNLERAKIILLLISSSFVASDYCFDIEMRRALERHAAKDAVVIPVILRPVFWKILPFAELQALPDGGKPIVNWRNRDEAFANVAEGLRKAIFQLYKPSGRDLKLSEENRWIWIIELESTVQVSSIAWDLLKKIQTLVADERAKIVALSDDKNLIVIEGSEEGFQKIEAHFRQGTLSSALGIVVTSVRLTYGATTTTTSEPAIAESQEESQTEFSPDLVLTSDEFSPCRLLGIFVPDGNFSDVQTIIDTGKEDPTTDEFNQMPTVLLSYFTAALRVDSDSVWCNLSAYESNRMVPAVLGDTVLGRDLLEQDVLLKSLSASLLHPDTDTGKNYWREVFARSERTCRTTSERITTFQKIWIMPTEAQVYTTELPETFNESDPAVLRALSDRHGKCAFITRAELGVFCEEDLYALQAEVIGEGTGDLKAQRRKDANQIAIDVFKEMILPIIKEEVNERYHFRKLRRIYSACILAKWFKEEFESDQGYKAIMKSNRVDDFAIRGVRPIGDESTNPPHWKEVQNGLYLRHAAKDAYQNFDVSINRQFHSAYMRLFRDGMFDVVRPGSAETVNGPVLRRYFSGAIDIKLLPGQRSASPAKQKLVIANAFIHPGLVPEIGQRLRRLSFHLAV